MFNAPHFCYIQTRIPREAADTTIQEVTWLLGEVTIHPLTNAELSGAFKLQSSTLLDESGEIWMDLNWLTVSLVHQIALRVIATLNLQLLLFITELWTPPH